MKTKQSNYKVGTRFTINKWILVKRSEKSVDILPNLPNKYSQIVIAYGDGTYGYDFPEQIPAYIQKFIERII